MQLRTQLLERWQTLTRENEDFLNSVVPERVKADPKFDFMTDTAYRDRCAEIDKLSPQIQELAAHEKRTKMFDSEPRTRVDRKGRESDVEIVDIESDAECRALATYLRSGGQDKAGLKFRADMIAGTNNLGGYSVPLAVSAQIIQDLAALESVRRHNPQIMPVQGNENIPVMQDATAEYVAEAGTLNQTDPTMGVVTIRPMLLQANTVFSWQLMNRSVVDIMAEIQRSFARGIAKTEAAKFLKGSGTNEPEGITVGGTAAVTAASATALTPQEIEQLWDALRPEYQVDATWFMAGPTLTKIRNFEDTNGNRLVQKDMTQGVNTLEGRPIEVDPNMPASTAALKAIAVGSIPQGYVIGEEKGLATLVDPYTKAATGKQRLYVYKFNDGRVKVPAAIQVLTMHA